MTRDTKRKQLQRIAEKKYRDYKKKEILIAAEKLRWQSGEAAKMFVMHFIEEFNSHCHKTGWFQSNQSKRISIQKNSNWTLLQINNYVGWFNNFCSFFIFYVIKFMTAL